MEVTTNQTTHRGWLRSICYRAARVAPVPLIRFVSLTGARFPWLKRRLDWYRDMLRHHDGTIKHGVAKGLLFNTGGSNTGFLMGTAEPDIQKVFEMLVRPGSVVYDIGANVGFFTLVAARLTGPSGKVLAFEPLPSNLLQLQSNAQRNHFDHVEGREMALSDRDGTALFLISKSPTWGELASVSGKVENEIGRAEVTTRRLDSVVQKDSLPLPDLIKIDVEGAETQVLDGAWETIQRARPVLVIELHGTNAAISQRLEAMNYFPAVLGSTQRIIDAYWNAHIIAFPASCDELVRVQTGEFKTS